MPREPPPRAKAPNGKFLGGAMARVIPPTQASKNSKHLEETPFSLHGEVWRRPSIPVNPSKSPPKSPGRYVKEHFGATDAKVLSQGGYGETFVVKLTTKTLGALEILFGADLRFVLDLRRELPPVGSSVVVKIAKKRSDDQMVDFICDNCREAAAHVHIVKFPSMELTKPCAASLHPAKYVPAFYGFGIDFKSNMAITVMQRIRGLPLRSLEITPAIFHNVIRAVSALYAAGVDHGDMHFKNIMVAAQGSRVYIIDFGFSVRLPEEARRKFLAFFKKRRSVLDLNVAAEKFALAYTDAVQYKRHHGHLEFYNPAHAALRVLWSRMTPEAQAAILKLPPTNLTVACLNNMSVSE